MEKEEYIEQIENLDAEQIVEGIINGIVTFEELRKTAISRNLYFGADKQKSIRTLLKKKDDDTYVNAHTIAELKNYLCVFPEGKHVSKAWQKIRLMEEQEDARKKATGT